MKNRLFKAILLSLIITFCCGFAQTDRTKTLNIKNKLLTLLSKVKIFARYTKPLFEFTEQPFEVEKLHEDLKSISPENFALLVKVVLDTDLDNLPKLPNKVAEYAKKPPYRGRTLPTYRILPNSPPLGSCNGNCSGSIYNPIAAGNYIPASGIRCYTNKMICYSAKYSGKYVSFLVVNKDPDGNINNVAKLVLNSIRYWGPGFASIAIKGWGMSVSSTDPNIESLFMIDCPDTPKSLCIAERVAYFVRGWPQSLSLYPEDQRSNVQNQLTNTWFNKDANPQIATEEDIEILLSRGIEPPELFPVTPMPPYTSRTVAVPSEIVY